MLSSRHFNEEKKIYFSKVKKGGKERNYNLWYWRGNMDKIAKFIKDRPALKVRRIEIDCNVPVGTLSQRIRYDIPLPKKYKEVLEDYLKLYGYKK